MSCAGRCRSLGQGARRPGAQGRAGGGSDRGAVPHGVRHRVRGARHGGPRRRRARGRRLAHQGFVRRPSSGSASCRAATPGHGDRGGRSARGRLDPGRRAALSRRQLHRLDLLAGAGEGEAGAAVRPRRPRAGGGQAREEPQRQRRLRQPAQRAPDRRPLHRHQPPQGAGRAAPARGVAGRGLRPDQGGSRVRAEAEDRELGRPARRGRLGAAARPGTKP